MEGGAPYFLNHRTMPFEFREFKKLRLYEKNSITLIYSELNVAKRFQNSMSKDRNKDYLFTFLLRYMYSFCTLLLMFVKLLFVV